MTNATRIVKHFNVTTTQISHAISQDIIADYELDDTVLTAKNMWSPTDPQGDYVLDQTFNKITFKQAILTQSGTIYVSTETDPMKTIDAVTTSNAAPSATTGSGFIPISFVANIINPTYTFYGQFSRLRMISSAGAIIVTVILERV